MIHLLVPEIDAGDVIVQRIVPIEPGDTVETFEARMHEPSTRSSSRRLEGASSKHSALSRIK